ncbi:enoyl-CoA hydratase/carnithine racemase [Rhodoligotrophos appendicifer]|uniref:enoyl-CoA hydratase/isomerase family protein n=1 Tax=Rhodoligotrophos appendicifer TaxID=987056 RepID=UPI001186C1EE|nr:enoyl-CoA hydratase/isomerase family protein [Rhodoligotrophos appendicifer]
MSIDPQPALLVETRGAVAVITLNRPDSINAINDAIRNGLPAALRQADEDPDIRVILIHGAGPRGFCAGADIKEKRDAETPVAARRRLTRDPWIQAFDRTTKPIIAAIHGACMGGGLEMALACDIRIAAPDAKFSLPETGLGLIPGAGGTQRLPRVIGLGPALDMLLTGDRIDAAEALRLGLVSRLVENVESLLPEALALALKIAARAPLATLYVKEATVKGAGMALADGMALEANLFSLLLSTQDKIEAARAFVEKRAPQFTGE